MATGRRSSGDLVRLAEYQVDRPTLDYPSDGSGPGGSGHDGLRGLPAKIGRYTVLGMLGEGGMGVVCTAWDPKLDRKVALKLLRRRKGKEGERRRMTSQARLVREAKSLARLSHRNIVTVHDVDTFEGQIYMAMEYVDGTSLDKWLIRGDRPWREVVDVFIDAAHGLAAAHEAGITHRDFKPANVLLGKDGRVTVVDFGLAKNHDHDEPGESAESADDPALVDPAAQLRSFSGPLDEVLGTTRDTKLTQVGRTVGTPAYMAPEQFLGLPTGPETDQFSFGVALFEALYGYLPFPDDNRDELIDRVTAGEVNEPPKDTPVPGWVHRVVLRTLRPRPEHRFPSMHDLVAALRADPAKRRRRNLALGGAAVLLGLSGYGVVQGLTPDPDLCSGAEARMEQIWADSRRSEISDAFVATGLPFAPDAWARAELALDERAERWAEVRTDVCEATNVRGEQSAELMDVRMACLDRRYGEMRAVIGVLAEPDERLVEGALETVESLDAAEDCQTLSAGQGMSIVDPQMRAKADEAEAHLAQSKAMGIAGRTEPALEHAVVALQLAREVDHAPLLARATMQHALRLMDRSDDNDLARQSLVETIELASDTDQHALEAEAWSMLIVLDGDRRGMFDAATALRLPARMAVERANDLRVEAIFDSAVGTVLFTNERHEEAVRVKERALENMKKALGDHDTKVQAALSNLGAEYAALGRHEQARAILTEAARIVEKVHGPNHPLLGSIHINLGSSAQGNDDYEEAHRQYLRAHEILSRALGPDSRRTLKATIGLAQTEAIDDPARAQRRYEELLAIARGKSEPDLMVIFTAHNSLGRLQGLQASAAESEGRLEDARRLREAAARSYRDTLDTLDRLFGDKAPAVHLIKVHLNFCLLEHERRNSEGVLDNCGMVWQYEREQGTIDRFGVEAMQMLADEHVAMGDTDQAIEMLRQAVARTPVELSVPLRLTLAERLLSSETADVASRSEAMAIVHEAQRALASSDAQEVRDLERWIDLHP